MRREYSSSALVANGTLDAGALSVLAANTTYAETISHNSKCDCKMRPFWLPTIEAKRSVLCGLPVIDVHRGAAPEPATIEHRHPSGLPVPLTGSPSAPWQCDEQEKEARRRGLPCAAFTFGDPELLLR
jgi:hypothetical protein